MTCDEIHGFHMSDIDFIAKYVGEDDFRDISSISLLGAGSTKHAGSLLLLVSVQITVYPEVRIVISS